MTSRHTPLCAVFPPTAGALSSSRLRGWLPLSFSHYRIFPWAPSTASLLYRTRSLELFFHVGRASRPEDALLRLRECDLFENIPRISKLIYHPRDARDPRLTSSRLNYVFVLRRCTREKKNTERSLAATTRRRRASTVSSNSPLTVPRESFFTCDH